MPEAYYEILSLAARYWFALLGVVIVWRSFGWLRKDRRLTHKRLKTLPDAGLIGELVVLEGSDELPEGVCLPVPREGILGSVRTCDIVVPVHGVDRRHLNFSFVDGLGLVMAPEPRRSCLVDGETVVDRRSARSFPMRHGSMLFVGDAVLKLRLFAGLDAPYPAEFQPDAPLPPEPTPDPSSMPLPPYPPYSPFSPYPGYGPYPPDPNEQLGRLPDPPSGRPFDHET